MKINVRQAKVEDGPALCRLDSICTQGKSIVFHYQRRDFFTRSRVYDKWAVFLAEADKGLVGMITACLKKIRIQGKIGTAAYIYDLRVDPAWRGRGIAGRMIRQLDKYLRKAGVVYAYTYILNENIVAYRISRFLGMFDAGQYKILIFPVRKNNYSILKLENQEKQRVLKRIEANLVEYDFTEKYSLVRKFNEADAVSPFKGVFSLKENTKTAVCVYDSSILAAKIVDKIPFYLRLLDLGGSWLKNILHLPNLPKKREPLLIWHLFNFWQDNQLYNKSVLLALLKAMQGYAFKTGIHILMTHLDVRDPLLPLLKGAAQYIIEGKILMRTHVWQEPPPVLKKIFLDVRDF